MIHADEDSIIPPHKSPSDGSQSVLIHLPSHLETLSPAIASLGQLHDDTASLSEQLPTTSIASVRYRLTTSPSYTTYPTPIHDTATAFHHILSTFDTSTLKPKVCLYGSYIGGALAAMIALTQPKDVHGLAIAHPLLDWISLDEYVAKSQATPAEPSPSVRSKASASLTPTELSVTRTLLGLRRKLFRNPAAYFDPFASPVMFLRAPGRDTPLSHNIRDQHDELELFDEDWLSTACAFGPYDDDMISFASPQQISSTNHAKRSSNDSEFRRSISGSRISRASESSAPGGDEEPHSSPNTDSAATLPAKRRKVLRRWPPMTSDIPDPFSTLLPYTGLFSSVPPQTSGRAKILAGGKVTVNENSPGLQREALNILFTRQSREFASLAKRACFSRLGWSKEYAEEEAAKRVQLQLLESNDIPVQMARWLRNIMEQP